MIRMQNTESEGKNTASLPLISTRFNKPLIDNYVTPFSINSQAQLATLKAKFPHKIFSIGGRKKVRSAGEEIEGIQPRAEPLRLRDKSSHCNDILSEMKKLKRDCVQILHNRLEESKIRDYKTPVRKPLSRIKVCRANEFPTQRINPNTELNRINVFFHGINNTSRNKNVCERFNSGKKLAPLYSKDSRNIFAVNSADVNAMKQTGYFGTKNSTEVAKAKPRAKDSAIMMGKLLNKEEIMLRSENKRPVMYHRKLRYPKVAQKQSIQ
eukprot:TRINITY_DN12264_c0_g1_i3.p1 TRINITY_DN12264_c0_g1~~TRINITY_DN12264_c0_g1_i3.p1  ORF type:complete len:267 (+),score=48.60 TRINITY_DN12264_c0_g1_i3:181-981(+)